MDKLKKDLNFYFLLTLTLFFSYQLLLALAGFLQYFQDILIIIFLGWFIYFILNPVVKRLVSKGIPRTWSVLLMFLALLGLVSVILAIFIPLLVSQLMIFNNNLPALLKNTETSVILYLKQFKIIKIENIDGLINSYLGQIVSFASSFIGNWLAILSTTFNITFNLLMVFLIGAFWLFDEKQIYSYFSKIIPQSLLPKLKLLDQKIHNSFGGFIRGQLIMGLVNGICTGIVLGLLGVEYLLLAGILAAFIMLIPFFNGFLAFLPGVLITLLVKPELWFVVLIILFVIHAVEFNVLAPKIMGDSIGLHPIVVIVAILVGIRVAGIFGGIFAIPIAGVLAIFPEFLPQNKKKPLFEKEK